MGSAVLLHVVGYAAVAVFVLAVVIRYTRLSRMPIHVRWELYPVAHEADRAHYGGSVLEEVDWWTKPRHKSMIGELKVMIPEIGFLAALFHHNRKLWWRSFPFHFGLYCLAGFIGLTIVGAIAGVAGANVGPDGGAWAVLHWLTVVVGVVGLCLAFLGAVGLLTYRLSDPDLRNYTSPGTIANLLFFIVALGVGLAAFAVADTGFIQVRGYVASLISFDLTAEVTSPLVWAEILLGAILIAYIPMTHMSHFFTKWFTYHKMKWDDEPNVVGGKIEKRVIEAVQQPVTWAAPHIKADGKKNWVDIATEEID